MKVLRALLLALTFASASVAWGQSRYSYLHESTNEVFRLLSNSMQIKPDEVAKVAALTCKTLERLLQDNDFRSDLGRMTEAHRGQSAYHSRLLKEVRFFADSFVRLESKLLKDSGVSDDASKQILSSATHLKESLSSTPDAGRILADLQGLKSDICSAALTISKEADDAKAQLQRRDRVIKWGMGLGGVSMILVDIPALAPSAGAATASFALGGALVGAAVAK